MAESGRLGRAAAALLLAVVGAGCGAGGSAYTKPGSTGASTSTAGAPQRVLAAEYLAIARAGNRRLEVAFDPLKNRDLNSVARADADLRAAAVTERLFDRRLLRISFPPATERVAQTLYEVNQVRARLTTAAAQSRSVRALREYESELNIANRPVEQAVRAIRRQLGLPQPPSS
jgi:hypothetical protein